MLQSYVSARWAAKMCGLAVLCLSVGCSLDFDQFEPEGGNPNNINNLNNVNNLPDGGDMEVDADMSVDMLPDLPPPDLPIGASCVADEDCGATKVCQDGYCSMDCAATECPEASECIEWSGELRCAVSCEGTCAVEEREDLSCVRASTPEGGWTLACLTDEDADATSDLLDNCPGMANPSQVDYDFDGEGDACDTNVFCFAGAETGPLDLGQFPAPMNRASYPSYSVGSSIPFVGGRDGGGDLSDEVRWLDLAAGTFDTSGPLPYAGVEFAVAHQSNGFILSPGVEVDNDLQEGRFITIDARGSQVAKSFQRSVSSPVFLRTSDGRLWLHGFDSPTSTRWRVFYFEETAQAFYDTGVSGTGNRREWYAAVDSTGRGTFYCQGRNVAQSNYVVTMVPGNISPTLRGYDLPDVTDPFDPLMVPGMGETFWLWERQTGQAWVIDTPTGVVTRVAEMDITTPSVDRKYIALQGGFALVSKDAIDATEVNVSMYSVGCWPGAVFNRDADTLPDVLDNCPFSDNEEQDDLDLDLIGDVCDSDDDGDEILDGDDFVVDAMGTSIDLSLDSDNDQTPNATDADADGDGVDDTLDRFWIDTNNNGGLNAYDPDDDADGYQDFLEWADSNAQDRLKVPNSGWVAFVRDTGNGRTVEIARFNDLRTATQPLTLADPHLPRLWTGGGLLMALNGPPETATGVFWADRVAGTSTEFEVGSPLRGADPSQIGPSNELLEFFVTNQRASGADWEISRASVVAPDVILSPFYSRLPNIGAPDFYGSIVVADAAQNGCVDCADPWQVVSAGTATRLAYDVLNPHYVRYQVGYVAMVGDDPEGGRSAYTQWGGTQIMRPEGATDVNSVAPMVDGGLLVSAKDDTGTFNLWFFNRRNQTWSLVLSSEDDLIEIDWNL